MTRQEAIEILKEQKYFLTKNVYKSTNETDREWKLTKALNMAIEALEQESIKFYYVESIDDYWIGARNDNFYYATWHRRFGFIWSHSKYLPWGEHVVDENTWWKEHTYPSEPKEITFTEWIVGFTKKYFRQESKRGKWLGYSEEGLKWECSECCSKFTTPWDYCPSCGADMRGDEE